MAIYAIKWLESLVYQAIRRTSTWCAVIVRFSRKLVKSMSGGKATQSPFPLDTLTRVGKCLIRLEMPLNVPSPLMGEG